MFERTYPQNSMLKSEYWVLPVIKTSASGSLNCTGFSGEQELGQSTDHLSRNGLAITTVESATIAN